MSNLLALRANICLDTYNILAYYILAYTGKRVQTLIVNIYTIPFVFIIYGGLEGNNYQHFAHVIFSFFHYLYNNTGSPSVCMSVRLFFGGLTSHGRQTCFGDAMSGRGHPRSNVVESL